jgi:hypothetical protein
MISGRFRRVARKFQLEPAKFDWFDFRVRRPQNGCDVACRPTVLSGLQQRQIETWLERGKEVARFSWWPPKAKRFTRGERFGGETVFKTCREPAGIAETVERYFVSEYELMDAKTFGGFAKRPVVRHFDREKRWSLFRRNGRMRLSLLKACVVDGCEPDGQFPRPSAVKFISMRAKSRLSSPKGKRRLRIIR